RAARFACMRAASPTPCSKARASRCRRSSRAETNSSKWRKTPPRDLEPRSRTRWCDLPLVVGFAAERTGASTDGGHFRKHGDGPAPARRARHGGVHDSVEARRVELVQKIGENISLRRFARREAKGRIASYVHGARIGVIVDVTGGADTLGKDLALHIAASKPIAVRKEDVPVDIVEKERT